MTFINNDFPEIKAIFLAQFHPDLGPMVRLSIPEDSCTDSNKIDFNSIQALVIPKLTLFERLITINTGKYKVMCYPIAVEGKYVRNVFIFNMCFTFDIDADTKCYGPVVKRVGCLLKELEITSKLLSDPESSRPLKTMMRQLVNMLNAYGEYQIELDLKGLSQPMGLTGISVKIFPHFENPQDIKSYHVPVKMIDFNIAKHKSAQTIYQTQASDELLWDLVIDRVTECIDNVTHVGRISKLTQIREETVIQALKHLDYYGCIALVDIFQFCNIYEPQYQMMDLFRNGWLQRECYNYVTSNGQTDSISLEKLIQLYSTIRQRKTVAEWVIENDVDVDQCDVRRLMVFGVIFKLLKRVHCYPMLCEPATGNTTSDRLSSRLLGMLDGTHHLDEICVSQNKDTATLYNMFDQHGGIEYIFL
ncbi:nitrogen permease regulator 2 [Coemansia reversa NRRL 1564]|uniref:Nitrogen permease regulator 2 n=1 Tax=Coemansia reversa (strain ATCC 12441 / NRRL 1564) TaxID=763665 RepID=A0A2G5BII8_COERN|nr:nitrogen permease regulator 2 [Coemansia reversa NRRL 1564]|eukprot:PIA18844.1 nitrogen permease regulator 2 [Coemansia reversa NRRL 1564]